LLAATAAALVVMLSSAVQVALAREVASVARHAASRYARYLAPQSACPNGASLRASFAEQREAMRCLVNWARWRVGLHALRQSAVLDRSSDLKAGAINRCRDFSHTACGRPFDWAFQQVGYLRAGRWEIGENIAAGTGWSASARGALLAWLNSPEHRHNLLDPGWRDQGVALVHSHGVLGLPSATVWVNQFGRRG
jgi:uncharacterized protein YkwD